MKHLTGTASEKVAAPAERCLAFLAAVDEYPRWHPEVVRDVQVLDRDEHARPLRARATLHVAVGPLVRDFRLVLAVTVDPPVVKLTRLPNEPSDEERLAILWRIREDGAASAIDLQLDAMLSVPRLLPPGGGGELIAHGLVSAR